MARLVRCDKCERTYDASAKAVGTRFHCQCGAELEVVEAKGRLRTLVSPIFACDFCPSVANFTTLPSSSLCHGRVPEGNEESTHGRGYRHIPHINVTFVRPTGSKAGLAIMPTTANHVSLRSLR